MKKSLILVGMLSIGYAYAQEGTVGINTELPKATLDINPNIENAKATATTNEGLLIPRLGKSRVALMATPETSTLVYVNDTAYTPENAANPTAKDQRVAEIDAAGFYHYNGTKWVKHIDGNGVGTNLLWEKEASTGNIKLVDAASGDNHIYYNPQGGLNIIPKTLRKLSYFNLRNGEVETLDFAIDGSLNELGGANATNFKLAYADKLKGTDPTPSYYRETLKFMNKNLLLVDEKAESDPFNTYTTTINDINVPENSTRNYTNIQAGMGFARYSGKGSVTYLIGNRNRADVYGGSVDRAMGGYNEAEAYGEYRIASLEAASNNIVLGKAKNTSVISTVTANNSTINIKKDAVTKITTVIGGHYLYKIPADYLGSISYLYGVAVNLKDISNDTEKIEEVRGMYIANVTKGKKANYGLQITDVGRDEATENFAIHTSAGKVRVGDLADASATADRTVVVDKDGVLKVGTASGTTASKVGTTTGVECKEDNRGTMNFGRITINGKATDAIGFCMKNGDNEFRWYYIYGGAAHTVGTSAVFGSGL